MFHDVSIIPMMHVLLFFWMGIVNNLYTNRQSMMERLDPLPVETIQVEPPSMAA